MTKRTPLKCSCRRAFTKRCAAPVKGSQSGAACGVLLCSGCGVKQDNGTLYCRPHSDIAKKERENAAS
jgi:hypothetical protein